MVLFCCFSRGYWLSAPKSAPTKEPRRAAPCFQRGSAEAVGTPPTPQPPAGGQEDAPLTAFVRRHAQLAEVAVARHAAGGRPHVSVPGHFEAVNAALSEAPKDRAAGRAPLPQNTECLEPPSHQSGAGESIIDLPNNQS